MSGLCGARPASQVICVLGVHRSGTSLLSRIVDLLGVSLGPPEHLTPPNSANPRGFWENFRLVDLNNRLLLHLGGRWNDPPSLSEGWEVSPGLELLHQEAAKTIAEEFGDKPVWGWKDPRSCITLPFWQRIIPSMRYVICLRNPLDVVLSLQARDKMDPERAAYLWFAYVNSMIRHTEGFDRIMVFHHDFFQDWREWVRRLSRFVGRSEAVKPYVMGVIESEIDPELVHHQSSQDRMTALPEFYAPAKALYMSLRLHDNRDSTQSGAAVRSWLGFQDSGPRYRGSNPCLPANLLSDGHRIIR